MNAFMDEDFLLSNPTARALYHTYAASMPIIDYHCHVSPREIYEDRVYENITQVWLGGDHYKWRLMRACGVDEYYITGNAGDYEKFCAFANILPACIGNPVYHWAHLELKRYFDCNLNLSADTSDEIWALCNEKLRSGLSVREIIKRSNVAGIATTEDPVDSLQWHEKIQADPKFDVIVKPAWRPDKFMNITKPGFGAYVNQLGNISDMENLCAAIRTRMDYFDAHGCTASDHGIEFLEHVSVSEETLNAIVRKGLYGEAISRDEEMAYQYALMRFLGEEYAKRGWVMELHYGTIRNINTKQFSILGPDTGYDAIAPNTAISGLPRLLDELYSNGCLPKTILFSLNPADNAMINTIAGGYHQTGSRGHVQQGAAWWFNDSKQGMQAQMTTMASLAPLGNFLGMVTDSRSFLSYTRHEYFRRILCDLLGEWVERGEYPYNINVLGALVQDISYNNAKDYFKF